MIFVQPRRGRGRESAEEMTLQIIVRQNQSFGFMTDGERNVFKPKLLRRFARAGRGSGFVMLAAGKNYAAAREQEKKT
jgi:hypothetical protein